MGGFRVSAINIKICCWLKQVKLPAIVKSQFNCNFKVQTFDLCHSFKSAFLLLFTMENNFIPFQEYVIKLQHIYTSLNLLL